MSGARSLEVRLKCSLVAGRFDYLPLTYWNHVEDHDDDDDRRRHELHYSARLRYSGVSVIRSPVHIGRVFSHVALYQASVSGLRDGPAGNLSVGRSVCLSVRKVYCGKTVEWIRIPLGR